MPLDFRNGLEEEETNEEVVYALIEPSGAEAYDQHDVDSDVTPGVGPRPFFNFVGDGLWKPEAEKSGHLNRVVCQGVETGCSPVAEHRGDEGGNEKIRDRSVIDSLVPATEEKSTEHRHGRDITSWWETEPEPFLRDKRGSGRLFRNRSFDFDDVFRCVRENNTHPLVRLLLQLYRYVTHKVTENELKKNNSNNKSLELLKLFPLRFKKEITGT